MKCALRIHELFLRRICFLIFLPFITLKLLHNTDRVSIQMKVKIEMKYRK